MKITYQKISIEGTDSCHLPPKRQVLIYESVSAQDFVLLAHARSFGKTPGASLDDKDATLNLHVAQQPVAQQVVWQVLDIQAPSSARCNLLNIYLGQMNFPSHIFCIINAFVCMKYVSSALFPILPPARSILIYLSTIFFSISFSFSSLSMNLVLLTLDCLGGGQTLCFCKQPGGNCDWDRGCINKVE